MFGAEAPPRQARIVYAVSRSGLAPGESSDGDTVGLPVQWIDEELRHESYSGLEIPGWDLASKTELAKPVPSSNSLPYWSWFLGVPKCFDGRNLIANNIEHNVAILVEQAAAASRLFNKREFSCCDS